MTITRRRACALAMGAAAIAAFGPAFAAYSDAVQQAIDEATGGAEAAEGKITLTAPEIAENGNTVPIEVEIEGDPQSVTIIATKNPNPGVVSFEFSAMAAPMASTRIRLAETQDVVAVAKMKDGSVQMARREIKVTIGGCGG